MPARTGTDSAGSRAGWSFALLTIVLFAASTLLLMAHFGAYLLYAAQAITYPFELDYGEGIVWYQALMIPDGRMYGDITTYPFIAFHYPPAYHMVSRALSLVTGDMLVAGRLVSVASTLVIAGIAACIVKQSTPPGTSRIAGICGAAIAGLSIFCLNPMLQWSHLMRVDMLAIAFSFLGVFFAVRPTTRPYHFYLAVLFFVAAIFTKQTSVAAALATVPVLFLVNRWNTVRACLFGLAVAVACLAAMTWATDGGFLRHIVQHNINRFDLRVVYWNLRLPLYEYGFLLAAIISIVTFWWRQVGLRSRRARIPVAYGTLMDPGTRAMVIMPLYLFTSSLTLLTMGKSGATLNYFIEWMCTWCVLIGLIITTEVGRTGSAVFGGASIRFGASIPGFLAVLGLLFQAYFTSDPRTDRFRNQQQIAALSQLTEKVRAASGPVLSEDMVLLVRVGKDVPWEPSIFAELGSLGRWDETLITDMINHRRFSFIVTVSQPGHGFHEARFNPAVQRAIETAYPRIEEIAGYLVRSPPGPL